MEAELRKKKALCPECGLRIRLTNPEDGQELQRIRFHKRPWDRKSMDSLIRCSGTDSQAEGTAKEPIQIGPKTDGS